MMNILFQNDRRGRCGGTVGLPVPEFGLCKRRARGGVRGARAAGTLSARRYGQPIQISWRVKKPRYDDPECMAPRHELGARS